MGVVFEEVWSPPSLFFFKVLGCPSAELAKTLVAEEKERVEKQAESLGEEGLKEKNEQLEAAIAQNEVGLVCLSMSSDP